MPMNFAPSVLRTLFHSILEVVKLAVLVVSLPGKSIKLPPAVMHTQVGSFFWGWKLTTILAYVTTLSEGMVLMSSWDMTKTELVPYVPVTSSPCAKFPNSLPNANDQMYFVWGSLLSFRYLVKVFPITGCVTGAHKCSMSTSLLFLGAREGLEVMNISGIHMLGYSLY